MPDAGELAKAALAHLPASSPDYAFEAAAVDEPGQHIDGPIVAP